MTRYAFVLLILAPAPALAQADNPFAVSRATKFEDVASVNVEIVPAKARRGETVVYKVTVAPKDGAWTYPVHPKDSKQLVKNKFVFPTTGDLLFVEPKVADPAGVKEKPGGNEEYYPHAVTWSTVAVVSPKATPGKKTVQIDRLLSRVLACNEESCFSSKIPPAPFEILDGDPVAIDAKYASAVNSPSAPLAPTPPDTRSPSTSERTPGEKNGPPIPSASTESRSSRKTAKPIEQYTAELNGVLESLDRIPPGPNSEPGLGMFLLTAAAWGLISLVTPCVFPMIPITVSIFLKQAQGSLAERLKLAGVYCLTIISVLGVSAFALLKFMSWLSNHPVTNILLGGLFLVLALSLFGMYELTLPNVLSRRLQTKQSQGGVVGTIFAALAFTVISFTCVAPFLGGFAGITATGGGSLIAVPTAREVFGGLAFATAFAAPFFVLALVPGLLKALPRSGGWLDSVKAVMGFLELAAALKFFRTAELGFSTQPFFSFDLVLAGWVGISLACGLYLLNFYRLPHDEERPNIAVPRLLFALGFIGFALYLMPGLFQGAEGKKQRPGGVVYAWVDAFLLSDPETGLSWGTDLKDALDKSRREKRNTPVLIDFTGVRCTNCRYNENNVFTLPEVRAGLERFERVQLYTDFLPEDRYITDPGEAERNLEGDANKTFETSAFATSQLPLYAVVVPAADGRVKVLGVYPEGKINDSAAFVKFLKEAADRAKQ